MAGTACGGGQPPWTPTGASRTSPGEWARKSSSSSSSERPRVSGANFMTKTNEPTFTSANNPKVGVAPIRR